jgi:hypothetical protein
MEEWTVRWRLRNILLQWSSLQVVMSLARGTYQNGIKVKGYFKFLNGYEYIGHCLGNKFNGEGSLVFPSGKIISGEWKGYSLVDKGKIEYPNGEVYYGDTCNLKKHGKGYLFFTDGTKYVG